jgi:hypothetical protein
VQPTDQPTDADECDKQEHFMRIRGGESIKRFDERNCGDDPAGDRSDQPWPQPTIPRRCHDSRKEWHEGGCLSMKGVEKKLKYEGDCNEEDGNSMSHQFRGWIR